MLPEAFLIAALSLPSAHFTKPPILSWRMEKSEQDKLIDWIKKNAPGAEVFIHPNPQDEVFEQNHWERVPFTWRGNKIWIKRKPSDIKMIGTSA